MLILVFLSFPAAQAHAKGSPEPILYTYYRQMGWGDRIEVGFLDSNGDCWVLSGSDSELKWPYKAEEQIQYLKDHKFDQAGTLSHDDLFSIKSLISAVTPSDELSHPVADDAGTERTYAVRYGKDGSAAPIQLGMSGDSVFENTDYNAQGLYLAARNLFPGVTAYGGDMGPAGFMPVRISEFCSLGDLKGASVKAIFNDCESGPQNINLSQKEQKNILELAANGFVTGKVNAIGTTGGFRTYSFYRGSDRIGSIDICGGLLYRSDGMYSIAAEIGSD